MDFEAMKKQAESTNVEYDRILEQYSKLEVGASFILFHFIIGIKIYQSLQYVILGKW